MPLSPDSAQTTAAQARRSAWPAIAMAAAGFGLTLFVFYPGVMTFDAKYVYLDIAKGFYGDWQSPVMTALWALIGYQLPRPIPRMTYADAMRRFGSDKPDLRFGLELVECTDYFSGTPFRVFQAPYVGAVVMPGGASQPRRTLDGWQEWAKQRGHRGLAYVLIGEDGTLSGPVAKNLSDAERDAAPRAAHEPGPEAARRTPLGFQQRSRHQTLAA